jgi:hypothetical protein
MFLVCGDHTHWAQLTTSRIGFPSDFLLIDVFICLVYAVKLRTACKVSKIGEIPTNESFFRAYFFARV